MKKILFLTILFSIIFISCEKSKEVKIKNNPPVKITKDSKKLQKKSKNNKDFALKEKENKKLLDESKVLLSKNDYSTALLKLKRINITSSYYAEAQKMIKVAKNMYKNFKYDLAKKLSDNKDYDKSLKYLNSLLERYPDFDKAVKLKEEVTNKLSALIKK